MAIDPVAIIRAVRAKNPQTTVEVLISDLSGDFACLDTILDEKPEVFNHNIETVRSLTPRIRHKATYDRTLSVLSHAKKSNKPRFVKSGIMIGLGETEEEVRQTISDLHAAGCDIITIGQYLQPSRTKLRVKSFIPPEEFKLYEDFGLSLGVKHVYAGPFVRSSYNASLFVD